MNKKTMNRLTEVQIRKAKLLDGSYIIFRRRRDLSVGASQRIEVLADQLPDRRKAADPGAEVINISRTLKTE